jgi:hypothetical protein
VKHLILTHDVSCALGELARVARRGGLPSADPFTAVTELAVAAVAFTCQLAIDAAGRDPAEMRALERDLIAAISEVP